MAYGEGFNCSSSHQTVFRNSLFLELPVTHYDPAARGQLVRPCPSLPEWSVADLVQLQYYVSFVSLCGKTVACDKGFNEYSNCTPIVSGNCWILPSSSFDGWLPSKVLLFQQKQKYFRLPHTQKKNSMV
jgi:hypothetical protein